MNFYTCDNVDPLGAYTGCFYINRDIYMNIKHLWTVSILAAIFSSPVNATLIETDYQAAGDKLLTQDSVTNLQWLDLTSTLSISYSDMLNQLGPGGLYEGFRYATVNDIDTLQVDAGLFPGLSTSSYSVHISNAIDLMNMVGITVPAGSTSAYFTYGITSTPFDPTTSTNDRIVRGFEITSGGAFVKTLQGVINDGQSSYQTGSWLVRETPSPVPIPGALFLFISGFSMILGYIRKSGTSI